MKWEDYIMKLDLSVELISPLIIFDEYLIGERLGNYLRPILFKVDLGTLKVAFKSNELAPDYETKKMEDLVKLNK
jgi:hypothetical protein